MNLSTAEQWLNYIEKIHPKTIELGLERVEKVAKRLELQHHACPVIIVGGTNGKGSCVNTLAAIYHASGYKAGAFTSPALFSHNEQVRINQQAMSDEWFCRGFAAIEAARQQILLTPFEFMTLAALWIFKQHALDVLILEVGLGGRLDAVNVVEPDVSIVTSIDLDHTDWLGPTREHIGWEKAGIYRHAKPAICGDRQPPASLYQQAVKIGAHFFQLGQAFDFKEQQDVWHWEFGPKVLKDLPYSSLLTQNMAVALTTIFLLEKKLPVTYAAICTGIKSIVLPGRLEARIGRITEIYDVAHNPAAVKVLANYLQQHPCSGKTIAVFSMLVDKDINHCIQIIEPHIDCWLAAPLKAKRSASETILRQRFAERRVNTISFATSVTEALQVARELAGKNDRIVVFGSFHTVAEANSL